MYFLGFLCKLNARVQRFRTAHLFFLIAFQSFNDKNNAYTCKNYALQIKSKINERSSMLKKINLV